MARLAYTANSTPHPSNTLKSETQPSLACWCGFGKEETMSLPWGAQIAFAPTLSQISKLASFCSVGNPHTQSIADGYVTRLRRRRQRCMLTDTHEVALATEVLMLSWREEETQHPQCGIPTFHLCVKSYRLFISRWLLHLFSDTMLSDIQLQV